MCKYSAAAKRIMLRYVHMADQLKGLNEIPSTLSQWVICIKAGNAISSNSLSTCQ